MTQLTIENMADLARILRENPEWRETVRGIVMGDELTRLPQEVSEFRHEFSEFKTEMTEFKTEMTEFKADMIEFKAEMTEFKEETERNFRDIRGELNRLNGRVDNLSGNSYEIRVENVFRGIVRQRLGLIRPRILRGGKTGITSELEDLTNAAVDSGGITDDEQDDLMLLDFVCECTRLSDGEPVYFAAEISVTASSDDVARAVRRAEVLAKATGQTVIPGIVSATIDPERQTLAERQDVAALQIAES